MRNCTRLSFARMKRGWEFEQTVTRVLAIESATVFASHLGWGPRLGVRAVKNLKIGFLRQEARAGAARSTRWTRAPRAFGSIFRTVMGRGCLDLSFCSFWEASRRLRSGSLIPTN